MEALLLLLDVSVFLLVLFWAVKNDTAEGSNKGLFRFKDDPSGPSSPVAPSSGARVGRK